MKTKSYKATFFRHNPQFKNGGYVTERKIEAVSLPSARKRAREISEHPKLIIVVYPARGLDVGATESIHKLLMELRDQGAAILLISEDLDELMKLSDRVGVMFGGQIVGNFPIEEVDLEEVGLLMMGLFRPKEERIHGDGR